MVRWLIIGLSLLLCSCSGSSKLQMGTMPVVDLQAEQLYIVPFETIMVPEEVSAILFDLFVDRLNSQGAPQGVEFIILKQGLAEVGEQWLSGKSYLRGEVFAYIEEVGSTMTDLKARSRVRLYQPGAAAPVLQLTYPAETFYQNDYSSLPAERRKIAEKIAMNLADQFLAAISPR